MSARGLRAGLGRIWLAAALSALAAGAAWSSDTPENFPETDGTVHASLIAGNTLYIGGDFTEVNGAEQRYAAAIDLSSGDMPSWNPSPDAPVRALAASANGATIYIGGEFTCLGGDPPCDGTDATPRDRLAAVEADSGIPLDNWDPGASATVHAIAVSPDARTLYIGGEFTSVGGSPRDYIAGVEASTGAVTLWAPQADGVVRALAVAGDGASVYAGGDFDVIGGQVRRQLAELQASSAKATAWDSAVTGSAVHALLLSDTTLYAGGSFTGIGGQSRNNLAALDTTTDTGMADASWDPDVNGEVKSLALTSDAKRLYAGGTFTNVDVGGANLSRVNLAGFSIATAAAIAWNPDPDGTVEALALWPDDATLYAGGAFANTGGEARRGLAAFAVAAPQTTAEPAGGGHASAVSVTLTCNDQSGAGCDATYYTTDGTEPDTGSPQYSAPIAIKTETTLKYFSVDNDGNMEPVNTAVYAIDTTAPTTSVSLPGGLYGTETLEPVELTCNDDNLDLGCTTYFTVDGTTPTTSSTVYIGAFSLADLFPRDDVAPDEIDPLQDLAGTVELQFFSVDTAGNQEAVQSETYEVDLTPPVVTSSLPDGNHLGPRTVTLSCDDGVGSGCAVMYYTTDDTSPSDGTVTDEAGNVIPQTTRYTGPFTLSSGAILRVLAVDNAGNRNSNIVGIYSFTLDEGDGRSTVGGVDAPLLLFLALALLWRGLGKAEERAKIKEQR